MALLLLGGGAKSNAPESILIQKRRVDAEWAAKRAYILCSFRVGNGNTLPSTVFDLYDTFWTPLFTNQHHGIGQSYSPAQVGLHNGKEYRMARVANNSIKDPLETFKNGDSLLGMMLMRKKTLHRKNRLPTVWFHNKHLKIEVVRGEYTKPAKAPCHWSFRVGPTRTCCRAEDL